MSVPCACKICRIENVLIFMIFCITIQQLSVPYNGDFDKIDQIKSCLRILTSHFLTSRPHNLHQQQSFCLSAAFSGYCVYLHTNIMTIGKKNVTTLEQSSHSNYLKEQATSYSLLIHRLL